MRRKSNKIRNLAIYGVIGVIAYALIFQGGLPFADGTFNIPELRTVGTPRSSSGSDASSSPTSSGYFNCSIQLKSTTVDGRGNILKTYSGNIYSGSVTLELTDAGKDLGGIIMNPQFKCNATTNENYQMQIKKGELQISASVDGKLMESDRLVIYNRSLEKNEWTDVGNFSYYGNDLEQKIKNARGTGDYTANVKFILHGNVKVFWGSTQGYGYNYEFGIPRGAISVTAPLEVKTERPSDPDGDRFIGEYDDCPNEAEVFNGYLDYDGCPDTVKQEPQQETNPEPETDPELESELKSAEIFHKVDIFYSDGGRELIQIKDGNIELIEQSYLPPEKPTLSVDSKSINRIEVEPFLLVDSADWTMNKTEYTAKAVMTLKGMPYEINIGRPTSATTTSSQDILNQGYGLSLGKVIISGTTIASQQILEAISPTDVSFEVQVDGEVTLRNVRDQGIYKGVVISTVELFNMKYGSQNLIIQEENNNPFFQPKDDDEFIPTPENPCPVGVQNIITKTCEDENNDDVDGDGRITNEDDNTFKTECENNGWIVSQTNSGSLICNKPTGDDRIVDYFPPNENQLTTEGNIGGSNGLTGYCNGELSTEQCVQKLLSNPIELTFIIIAIVIFLGLIGGLVMRGRTNYGSGLQIPRPY